MKTILGIILCIAGIALGLYVGGYQCFIKGAIQVITEIRAEVLNTEVLVWGIAKMIFAGLLGGLSAFVLVIPGMAIIKD